MRMLLWGFIIRPPIQFFRTDLLKHQHTVLKQSHLTTGILMFGKKDSTNQLQSHIIVFSFNLKNRGVVKLYVFKFSCRLFHLYTLPISNLSF